MNMVQKQQINFFPNHLWKCIGHMKNVYKDILPAKIQWVQKQYTDLMNTVK